MDIDRIIAEELRKNDKEYSGPLGSGAGTIERYVLTVGFEDIVKTIRAVAINELNEQMRLNNPPSQVLVDNMSVSKRGIDTAKRRVVMRFQDVAALLDATREIYDLLQRVTRLQVPPKNNIVARQNFYLYVGNSMVGIMPAALNVLASYGNLTMDSVVRVVGPLVPYGRRLFWSPVGSGMKMQYYRVASKRGIGVRFLAPRDREGKSDPFYPRFRPFKLSTIRKKANRTANAAAALRGMLSGATPPGRVENAGQIVKRLIKRNPKYRGLHFTDGWIEYSPAVGWSKLADPRVPAMGVMFAKKGQLNVLGS